VDHGSLVNTLDGAAHDEARIMILAILITSFTFVLSGALHYVIVSSAIRHLGAAT